MSRESKCRPIIMSAPMVQATLRNVNPKTQTRRIMKPQPAFPDAFNALRREIVGNEVRFYSSGASLRTHSFRCPYGQVGDLLWVRETFCSFVQNGKNSAAYKADTDDGFYSPCETLTGGYPSSCAHHPGCEGCTAERWKPLWRPSIHMPRWASRITLEITGIRVERLQDISEEDAAAEGVVPKLEMTLTEFIAGQSSPQSTYRLGFKHVWDSIYGSWRANPWVWVVKFQRVELQNGESA